MKGKNYVHIRIQQRNGRKSITTVAGLSPELDLKKILRALKKVRRIVSLPEHASAHVCHEGPEIDCAFEHTSVGRMDAISACIGTSLCRSSAVTAPSSRTSRKGRSCKCKVTRTTHHTILRVRTSNSKKANSSTCAHSSATRACIGGHA